MKKFLSLIGSLILLITGLMLPIIIASQTVKWGLSFFASLFLVLFSTICTCILFFLAAVILGSPFPGIVSRINQAGENASNSLVHFLFKIKFAGADSYWQKKEDATATVGAGFWHGIILPITFLLSFFSNRITIYESQNDGFSYNYGFVTGAIGTISFLIDPSAFLEADYLLFVLMVGLPLILLKVTLSRSRF